MQNKKKQGGAVSSEGFVRSGFTVSTLHATRFQSPQNFPETHGFPEQPTAYSSLSNF
jgi:hypothetical protein